ncbi:MAG: peptide chain release factor 3, partial [Gemmatimonadetes bacterium]|nr:peptide chain release factor 3 [Gemmatimonadota bacterium]
PRHRDRIAFARICSGKFTAGMEVTHVRTGKRFRLSTPQQFMARERIAVEEAWPGDVIGVVDRGMLRIGDTLSEEGALEYGGVPRFPPEHFARVVLLDPMKRKQLDAGLRQLTEEGAAQVFFTSPTEVSGPTPIIGAVGMLQFDVMLHRLEHEYGVRCRLEKIGGRYPRWVVGPTAEIERIGRERGRSILYDATGAPLILFEDTWGLKWVLDRETAVTFHEAAP